MTERIPIKAIKTGATATALAEFADGDTIPSNYLPHAPAGYIDGLIMQWVSGTALTITSGAAYVPSLQRIIHVDAPIEKTGLSLPASAFSYVYLDGPTLDIVFSDTAPAAPYNGTARTMSGDTSKRYIGSIKTISDGSIFPFDQLPGGLTLYRIENSSYDSLVTILYYGTATSITTLDTSAFIPPTTNLGYFRLQVNAGSYAYLMPGDATSEYQADQVVGMGGSGAVGFIAGMCRIASNAVAYKANDTDTPTFIWIKGYYQYL